MNLNKNYLWLSLVAVFLFFAGISHAQAATITLTPASNTLSPVVIGNAYDVSSTISASSTDATDTFTWSAITTSLWATIATSTSGASSSILTFTVTGTPDATGTVSLVFTATGSDSASSTTAIITFTVDPATITTTPATSTLSNIIIGNAYSATSTISATSNDPWDTFTWSTSGTPSWATIATSTSGASSSILTFTVTGTPDATGTVSLVFTATGASSTAASSKNFTFTVNVATIAPTPASGTLAAGTAGNGYNTNSTITATSTDPLDTYSWSVSGAPSWATITTSASGAGSSTLNFTVAGTPPSGGSVTLIFTATGANSAATSSVSFTFTVGQPATGGAVIAQTAITQAVDNLNPTVGATIHYTITVSADGHSLSPSVIVSDTLPSGLTLVSATTSVGSYSSSTGQWNIGDLNVGASATLVLTATVNSNTAGDTIVNNASVTESTSVNNLYSGNGYTIANASITVAGASVVQSQSATSTSTPTTTTTATSATITLTTTYPPAVATIPSLPVQAVNAIFNSVLRLGSKGIDVTRLQQLLAEDPSIYPKGEITGYFGPLTERAVERFQAKYGIVGSGTPETTGYGMVGPETRTKLAEIFSGTASTSPSTSTAPAIRQMIQDLQQKLVGLLQQLVQSLQKQGGR